MNCLEGSNLLQTLTMPNGMTLTQQYEEKRDLLTGMEYKRGTSGVVERYYTYDALGCPLTRQQNRQGGSRSDSFTHNDRSELTAGILGTKGYYYAYDNIGNRKTAQENAEEVTNYDANALNQYTAVGEFAPEFDAAGNQTKVQTSTGIWDVTYNAENRPTIFIRENEDGTQTRITCAYDYMGRRARKKVETIAADSTATVNENRLFIYRGYLQIACCGLMETSQPCRWFIIWDPTQSPRRPVGGLDNSGAVAPEGRGRNGVRPSQPVATRPLAIRKDGTWYCYGWDLTKNICEVFGADDLIKTAYSYTPYGAVTASGTVTQSPRGLGGGLDNSAAVAPQGRTADGAAVSQPIQWSSEFYDDELGLVYYNYRHYNPADSRWLNRDLLDERHGGDVYTFVCNSPISMIDAEGNVAWFIPIILIAAAGGLSSCASPKPPTPTQPNTPEVRYALSYSTIEKKSNYCGEFVWVIKWQITPQPMVKGVIAQHIKYSGEYYTISASSNQIDRLTGGAQPFTEYWRVSEQGEFLDGSTDRFELAVPLEWAKGRLVISAEAAFYPNVDIPNGAKRDLTRRHPAGNLYYNNGRKMPNGVASNKVTRKLISEWDCLDCIPKLSKLSH